ncbi:MAG: GPR endopeptidase [Clostridia bacterium]|nr:GPR endopeptidase [Clostridia bacterium]
MEKYVRTDLACEMREVACESRRTVSEKVGSDGFRVIRTDTEEQGRCLAVVCGNMGELDDEEASSLALCVARELGELVELEVQKKRDGNFRVLVAGLGNASMTADAIGPSATSRVTVTGHLASLEPELFRKIGCCRIYAVTPGVLGETGMEALELIRGAVESVKPDLVVAVDALAARSVERLSSTVQMSTGGIRPGSGIGNRRSEISKKALGVPVISVGIPTVVDSSTLVYDALKSAGLPEPEGELAELLERGRGFFVSPKDCDVINRRAACILANAIDLTFGINRDHREYN